MRHQHSLNPGCLTGRLFCAIAFFCAHSYADQTGDIGKEQVAVYSVLAGGNEVSLSPIPNGVPGAKPQNPSSYSRAGLHLNLKGQPLVFRFGPATADGLPIRIRCRLEGYDEGWRDSGGHMVLHAGFLTSSNQPLGSEMREVRGQSPGWSGRIDASRFTPAFIETTAPELADRMHLRMHCGHPTASGIWAIGTIRVLQADTNGQWELLRTLSASPGQNLHSTQGTPRDWKRTDYNWYVPKVLTLNSNQTVVALVDKDPKGGGGWSSVPTQVKPGRRIRVEWDEVYTIGQSGLGQISYHQLPVGRYTFVVQATDESGVPTSPEYRLATTIVPPFYQTGWFWSATATLLAAVAIYGVRRSARRRIQTQADRARQQQMLTEERMRIARDLHDDLGSGLTRIALLIPQALRSGAAETAASIHLEQVAKQARELVLALDQIVWAVNPGQDTLEGLAGYLCDFATDLTRDANIRFWPKVPTVLPKVPITSPTRYNLFIAAKEALNNVARHSGASEVILRFDYQPASRELAVEIADNGCGIDLPAVPPGNGIANIRSRLQSRGGTAIIEKRAEGGTRVLLKLTLPEHVAPDELSTGLPADETAAENLPVTRN